VNKGKARRKQFFFEKKNQKTFANKPRLLIVIAWQSRPPPANIPTRLSAEAPLTTRIQVGSAVRLLLLQRLRQFLSPT
jgi:hypothetical protein